MKEIQVPGSVAARKDQLQRWSVEMDEGDALRELRNVHSSSVEEVLEFTHGDGREGISQAANIIVMRLLAITEGEK